MEPVVSKPRVSVLMSTYHGEKYMKEQIDSILSQKDVDVRLIVRDDGSQDGTLAILEDYQSRGLLTYYKGRNIGPKRSFLQLLQLAPESPYYAFADQDDFWLPEKLSVGVDAIGSYAGKPALYCSQTQLADHSLQPIPGKTIHPRLTFGESLIYAYASGCTMVFNQQLCEAVLSYQPEYLDMHDRWLVDVVTALGGHLVFDKRSFILYRQHTQNVIGLHDSRWKEWQLRFHRIFDHEHIRYRNAKEISQGYHDKMPPAQKDILELFLKAKKSPFYRMRLLFDGRYRCGSLKNWIMFKLAVLLNTY